MSLKAELVACSIGVHDYRIEYRVTAFGIIARSKCVVCGYERKDAR